MTRRHLQERVTRGLPRGVQWELAKQAELASIEDHQGSCGAASEPSEWKNEAREACESNHGILFISQSGSKLREECVLM